MRNSIWSVLQIPRIVAGWIDQTHFMAYTNSLRLKSKLFRAFFMLLFTESSEIEVVAKHRGKYRFRYHSMHTNSDVIGMAMSSVNIGILSISEFVGICTSLSFNYEKNEISPAIPSLWSLQLILDGTNLKLENFLYTIFSRLLVKLPLMWFNLRWRTVTFFFHPLDNFHQLNFLSLLFHFPFPTSQRQRRRFFCTFPSFVMSLRKFSFTSFHFGTTLNFKLDSQLTRSAPIGTQQKWRKWENFNSQKNSRAEKYINTGKILRAFWRGGNSKLERLWKWTKKFFYWL